MFQYLERWNQNFISFKMHTKSNIWRPLEICDNVNSTLLIFVKDDYFMWFLLAITLHTKYLIFRFLLMYHLKVNHTQSILTLVVSFFLSHTAPIWSFLILTDYLPTILDGSWHFKSGRIIHSPIKAEQKRGFLRGVCKALK